MVRDPRRGLERAQRLVRMLVGTDPSREMTLAVASGIRDTYVGRLSAVRDHAKMLQ